MARTATGQATDQHSVRFSVNGVELVVQQDLGKNLNSVIKTETNFKVTRALCGLPARLRHLHDV